jgi:hypothetical protein
MRILIIALPAKYNDKMKDDIGRECSTHVRREIHTKFWQKNDNERNRPLGRPIRRWNTIKLNIQEIG